MSFGNRLFSALRAPKPSVGEKQGLELPSASFSRCPFCQGKSILIRKKTSEKEVSYQAKCSALWRFGSPETVPARRKNSGTNG